MLQGLLAFRPCSIVHLTHWSPSVGIHKCLRRVRPHYRFSASTNTSFEDVSTPKFVTASPLRSSFDPRNSSQNDTIYALATPPSAASGVAIVRISGPAAPHTLLHVLRPKSGTSTSPQLPKPRFASLRDLQHPVTHDLLDRALVLYFPAPHSYTAEHVVELHLHGSTAVISAVTKALAAVPPPTPRPANRGEFTRRAFENGAVDLLHVEALADLIASETDAQRQQALRQLSGDAARILEKWRVTIRDALAHVEAVIDFSEDVGDAPFDLLSSKMSVLRDEMRSHLRSAVKTETVRTGARVVLVGPPNAGKSSLLNVLACRPAAIIAPTAGTTRDVLDVRLDLGGIPVTLSDTAGLRTVTTDPIEQEGIRRALAAADDADVVLCVLDASTSDLADVIRSVHESLSQSQSEYNSYKAQQVPVREVLEKRQAHVIYILNKKDLCPQSFKRCAQLENVDVYETSVLHNQGVDELVHRLEQVLTEQLQTKSNDAEITPVVTRARHRHHIQAAERALTSFIDGQSATIARARMPMDLAAENLRIAAKEVGAISGIIGSEEVLDVIFNEFCIGK